MDFKSMHVPTLVTVLIGVLVILFLYHMLFHGSKKES